MNPATSANNTIVLSTHAVRLSKKLMVCKSGACYVAQSRAVSGAQKRASGCATVLRSPQRRWCSSLTHRDFTLLVGPWGRQHPSFRIETSKSRRFVSRRLTGPTERQSRAISSADANRHLRADVAPLGLAISLATSARAAFANGFAIFFWPTSYDLNIPRQ